MRSIKRTTSGAILLCATLFWYPQPALAQFTQQGPKLVGTGAIGNAEQGTAVALSASGNTAIVGGIFDNNQAGAAWVFTSSGGVWTQQAKLVGTGAVGNAQQGSSVALSATGDTALVGGPLDEQSVNGGAVWVFTRSGGVWTQQAKLVGEQGSSVARSATGDTDLVGGLVDNNQAGAAWVFTRSGGVWSQQGGKLVGMDAVGAAEQGAGVALSADGNTALVGGNQDNNGVGAAWVFTRSGGVWSQQGNKLVGSGAVGTAGQGASVALSADGNTAIVGGVLDNGGVGAAWVFTRSNGVWSQQGNKLVGSGAVGAASQGNSVALSADGNTALVGGPGDSGIGAVWVFTRSAGVWSQQGNKLVGTGMVGGAGLGSSVALSSCKSTAIVGGPLDNPAVGFAVGATWVFFAPTSATHDFNRDGFSDILWRNVSGSTMIWLMDGTIAVGGGLPGSATTDWTIVGQRDFNGDGYADILWRNGTSGQTMIWLMNGASVIGTGSPGTVTTDWSVVGTGDFNGDGLADVLWYNGTTGQTVIWLMNGTSVIGGGSPGVAASPWTVAQTGDYNGDGFSDILWYNTTTGQVVIWLLNFTSVIGGGSPGLAASPWTIAGTGDFNGDGFSDILWWNSTTGQVVIWLVNGTSVIGGGSPGSLASPWTIAGTGNFESGCISDILWRNTTTGQLVMWLMNGGGGGAGWASIDWQIQGVNAD